MAIALELLGLVADGQRRGPGDAIRARTTARARVRRARDGAARARRARRATSSRARRSRTRSPSVAATGGSTNAVLHLLAIAREAGVAARRSTTSTRSRAHAGARRPQAGRPLHAPSTSTRAGGIALLAQRLLERGPARRTRRPSTGRTLARGGRAARETRRAGGRCAPLDEPLKPRGGFAILRGNLAPEGCVVKLAGHERAAPSRAGARVRRRGGRVRRGAARRDQGRRRRRDPLRGPARRSRHARDARASPPRSSAQGLGDDGRARHRRPLQRRDARLHGRPRRARGGAAAARSRCVRDGDTDPASTSPTRRLDVEADLDRHAARCQRPRPRRSPACSASTRNRCLGCRGAVDESRRGESRVVTAEAEPRQRRESRPRPRPRPTIVERLPA